MEARSLGLAQSVTKSPNGQAYLEPRQISLQRGGPVAPSLSSVRSPRIFGDEEAHPVIQNSNELSFFQHLS